MANELAVAYLQIIPSLKGAKHQIESQLAGVDTKASGSIIGGGLVNGMKTRLAAGSALITGAIAGIASNAVSSFTAAIGAGISRADIINNFPKVMSNFKISADDSAVAIKILSESLRGLPTGLDSAAAGVQRFVSKNGDIKTSTDMFLAVNNAILAGGASMDLQRYATEQLSQAYSKGKMEMEEWRSIQTAMPGQLKQVAEAMGMSVESLSAGLRGADKDVNYFRDVTMDEFMATIMQLNTEGANGFQSFEEQARNSTGGIQTSMTNVGNAMSRFWQGIMDSIGSDNIKGAASELSSGIDAAGKKISGFITEHMPGLLQTFGELASDGAKVITTLTNVGKAAVKPIGDLISGIGGKAKEFFGWMSKSSANTITVVSGIASAFVGLKVVNPVLKDLAAGLKNTSGEGSGLANAVGLSARAFGDAKNKGDGFFGSLKAGASTFNQATGLTNALKGGVVMLGTALAGMAIASVVDRFAKLREKEADLLAISEDLTPYIYGVGDAFIESGKKAANSTPDIQQLEDKIKTLRDEHVNLKDEIKDAFSDVYTKSALIGEYADKIEELGEKGNLTAKEQAELKLAVDGFNEATGENIEILDAQNGYLDTSIKYIQDMAKAWEQNAIAQASQGAIIDLYKQILDIQTAISETTTQLDSARAELATMPSLDDLTVQLKANPDDAELLKQFTATSEKAGEVANLQAQIDELNTSLETCYGDINNVNNAALQATMALDTSSVKIQEAIHSVDGIDAALEGVDITEFSTSLSRAGISSSALSKQSSDDIARLAAAWAADGNDMGDSAKLLVEELGLVPSDMAKAMELGTPKVKKAMEDLASVQIDPIAEIPGFLEMSAEKGTQAMIDAYNKKTGEVATAAKSGLADPTTNAASTVPGTLEAFSIESVNSWNFPLSKAEGTEDAAKSLPRAASEGAKSIGAIEAATSFVDGYVNRIKSKQSTDKADSAGAALASAALSALKRAQQSKSPAKKTEKEGFNFTEGYRLKMLAGIPAISNASKRYVKTALDELAHPLRLGDVDTSSLYIQNPYGITYSASTEPHLSTVWQDKQMPQEDKSLTTLREILVKLEQLLTLNSRYLPDIASPGEVHLNSSIVGVIERQLTRKLSLEGR